MKLTIIGATGRTGRLLQEQAVARGHDVRVLARAPRAASLRGTGVAVVVGDVRQPDAVREAVEGSDAVLSALGPSGREAIHDVITVGTTNIVAAMQDAAAGRRLVVTSAAPVAAVDGTEPLIYRYVARPLLRRVFARGYADMERMEAVVRASGLDWTIARPPRLIDRNNPPPAQQVIGGTIRGGFSLPRGALAAAMLGWLDDPATIGAPVGVGA